MRWISSLLVMLVACLTSGCFTGVGAAIGAFVPRYEEVDPPATSPSLRTELRDARGHVTVDRRDNQVNGSAMVSGTWSTVALSTAKEVGAPIATHDPNDDGVLVAWPERDTIAEPWRLRVIRWVPGHEVTVLEQHDATIRSNPPALSWTGEPIGASVQIDDASDTQTPRPPTVRTKVGSYWGPGLGIGALVDAIIVVTFLVGNNFRLTEGL